MVASEQAPSRLEKLVGPADPKPADTPAHKVETVVGIGWVLVGIGMVALTVGFVLWSEWITPTGTCFPPGGGAAIPCPAAELTSNDLAVVMVITMVASIMVGLGVVLVCLAWLHKPPQAELTD